MQLTSCCAKVVVVVVVVVSTVVGKVFSYAYPETFKNSLGAYFSNNSELTQAACIYLLSCEAIHSLTLEVAATTRAAFLYFVPSARQYLPPMQSASQAS